MLLLFIYLFVCLFVCLFMAVLGLRFCARVQPLLLWSTGSRRAGSVIVAHGPSCFAACGIFPDQGSNPCPPHWQADSQPPRHQGSPACFFMRERRKIEVDKKKKQRRWVELTPRENTNAPELSKLAINLPLNVVQRETQIH